MPFLLWRMSEISWSLEAMYKEWTQFISVCSCGVDRVCLRKMWLVILGQ